MKTITNENNINHFKLYLNSDSVKEKERIYNQCLFPYIDNIMNIVILQFKYQDTFGGETNDVKQQIHLYIYHKVLPIIDIKRIDAIQQLLYVTIVNQLANYNKLRNKKKIIKCDYNIDVASFEILDSSNDIEEYNTLILKKIDAKIVQLIEEQKYINSTNAVFLQLLQLYIEENNYNSEGFKEFVMNKMNIKESTFHNTACKIGISTLPFRKKKNKNNK